MAYRTLNPFNKELVKEFPSSTHEDISAAIEKGHQAFLVWRDKSLEERAALLQKAADILREQADDYAKLITLEMGKVFVEAKGEIATCVGMLEDYAQHGAEYLAPRYMPSTKYGKDSVRLVHEPQGIIMTVEPWNFPAYQVIRIAAPQLMAGNTVLLKHASIVPQCALAFEKLFRDAGFPDGCFQSLFISHDQLEEIIADPRVRGVALTGSEGAGSAVSAIAGKYLKKSTLELGGADAFIVLADADIDKAVAWAVMGRHWNGGQVCCSSKRMIIVDSIYDEFMEKYRAGVAKLRAGDPMDPHTQLAPLSSDEAVDKLRSQVEMARKEGVTVEEIGNPVPESGYFFQPTILTDIPEGAQTRHTEFFGPVTSVYRVKDEDEAITIANDSPYGLGGSIFTSDIEHGKELARRIDTGMVYLNHPTGVGADIPFGGVKNSGFGRELTDLGIMEFVNSKIIVDSNIDDAF
ncbi:MAG: NAD-dependent succinate-semialdehyde dehydrogenase [Actinomycetaceae bacterium]|nr:NAD-dependent succinate-semialdehyde dehydrogenase [Actinomycetaceae bacterium]MDY6083157.1 NAD-dependent succinate-semialdehyde dehydrogenase [Actinomycetaceae bacterium]